MLGAGTAGELEEVGSAGWLGGGTGVAGADVDGGDSVGGGPVGGGGVP